MDELSALLKVKSIHIEDVGKSQDSHPALKVTKSNKSSTSRGGYKGSFSSRGQRSGAHGFHRGIVASLTEIEDLVIVHCLPASIIQMWLVKFVATLIVRQLIAIIKLIRPTFLLPLVHHTLLKPSSTLLHGLLMLLDPRSPPIIATSAHHHAPIFPPVCSPGVHHHAPPGFPNSSTSLHTSHASTFTTVTSTASSHTSTPGSSSILGPTSTCYPCTPPAPSPLAISPSILILPHPLDTNSHPCLLGLSLEP
ncbi:hypothetical protein U1Q18_007745 [Sarracenia purpurea var. burkii]